MSQTKSVEEYPAGHLNHLTPEQTEALEEFKTTSHDAGCYSPPSNGTQASHDDETMLRFLRARKFVPKDALQQFKKTEDWRKEQDIESWYDTIDVEEFEATRKLYTHWTGRRDKRGIPLYVFKIGGVDTSKILDDDSKGAAAGGENKKKMISTKLRRLFATYEHLTQFVMPLCSTAMMASSSSSSSSSRPDYADVPVSQTCCIVDISGVGLRQFLGLKGHLQEASALATAHYPETLGRTFVVGAPGFFGTVWTWLQYWFDPITVAKIFILAPAEVAPTLRRFVDPDDIPSAYGGNLDWEFGQLPDLDPEIRKVMQMRDGANGSIPMGPIRWKESEDGSVMEAHALGTVSGKQRDTTFATVPSKFFPKSSNETATAA